MRLSRITASPAAASSMFPTTSSRQAAADTTHAAVSNRCTVTEAGSPAESRLKPLPWAAAHRDRASRRLPAKTPGRGAFFHIARTGGGGGRIVKTDARDGHPVAFRERKVRDI